MMALYDLISVNERTSRRVVLTPSPLPFAECAGLRENITSHPARRLVIQAVTGSHESAARFDIHVCEDGFPDCVGRIDEMPDGTAVLHLHGCDVSVPFYSNLAAAIHAVRVQFGYANAYLERVKEVA